MKIADSISGYAIYFKKVGSSLSIGNQSHAGAVLPLLPELL
jgi:hypothetical protein